MSMMSMAFGVPRGRVLRAWRSTSPAVVQRRMGAVEDRTGEQWIYTAHHIPDLLQTSDYATAIVTADTWSAGRPAGEVAAAVTERLMRQHRWRTAERPRHLEVVIGEQALYTTLGRPNIMEIQLRHLRALVESQPEGASIAIVPRHASYRGPGGDFTIVDERVMAATVTGALTLTRGRDVAEYRRAFDRLAEQAVRAEEAATLIAEAVAFRTNPRTPRKDR